MEVVSYQPPASAAAPPPIPVNRPPLKPGIQRKVTAMEREALEKLGWREGQPVPENLAEHLAAFREAERASLAADIGRLSATPPLDFDESRATPVASLSPAAQSELAASIASMTEMARTIEARSQAGPLPPGAAEAIRLAESPAPPPAPAPTAAPIPPSADSPTGLVSHPTRCPNCKWDLARSDVPEPTDDEKRQYLTAAMLGARYTWTTHVMGGNFRLTFRELTPVEMESIFTQANADTPASVDTASYFAKVLTYQFAAGLAEVEVVGRRRCPLPLPADPKLPEPKLPALLAYIRDKVLPTESLWSAAFAEHGRFRRLLERIVAAAGDEGFFAGIPGPA